MSEEPIKSGEKTDKDPITGKFLPNNNANPEGRPKGKLSIRQQILNRLEDNPEELKEIVEYFIKENRELMWQMLEGKPKETGDYNISLPKPILDVIPKNDSDNKDNSTG